MIIQLFESNRQASRVHHKKLSLGGVEESSERMREKKSVSNLSSALLATKWPWVMLADIFPLLALSFLIDSRWHLIWKIH